MRIGLVPLLLLLVLAACQREPDFDERYQSASDNIAQTSHQIDDRIAATQPAAAEMDLPDDQRD